VTVYFLSWMGGFAVTVLDLAGEVPRLLIHTRTRTHTHTHIHTPRRVRTCRSHRRCNRLCCL
jgi:hypothetical protein